MAFVSRAINPMKLSLDGYSIITTVRVVTDSQMHTFKASFNISFLSIFGEILAIISVGRLL